MTIVNWRTKKVRLKYNKLKWYLAVLLITYLSYEFTVKTIENIKLKWDGHYTKAIVFDKKNVGSKGVINTHYSFQIGNKKFVGVTIFNSKVEIGDSIEIVYYISNPKINRGIRLNK